MMKTAALFILSIFLLTACAAQTPTVVPLPDLTIPHARTSLTPPLCLGSHSKAGALVYIANVGTADSGAFVVNVNDVEQTVEGLPAGESRQLWFDQAGQTWLDIRVTVDVDEQVAESSEDNNAFVAPVVTLTPPVPCTPTPGAS